MPCSAIFKTFPTDRGMCCAFNMKKAEEIFKQGSYAKMVNQMQANDKDNAFGSNMAPAWYHEQSEPKSAPGIYKGLTVMLDAHTDLLASGSVDEDFQGFVAYVNAGDKFPLTHQRGIRLRGGHENIVNLKAVDIKTTEDTKTINAQLRGCYFPDEMELRLHKNYSQVSKIDKTTLSDHQNHHWYMTTGKLLPGMWT